LTKKNQFLSSKLDKT